jgi:hypothetical protein
MCLTVRERFSSVFMLLTDNLSLMLYHLLKLLEFVFVWLKALYIDMHCTLFLPFFLFFFFFCHKEVNHLRTIVVLLSYNMDNTHTAFFFPPDKGVPHFHYQDNGNTSVKTVSDIDMQAEHYRRANQPYQPTTTTAKLRARKIEMCKKYHHRIYRPKRSPPFTDDRKAAKKKKKAKENCYPAFITGPSLQCC